MKYFSFRIALLTLLLTPQAFAADTPQSLVCGQKQPEVISQINILRRRLLCLDGTIHNCDQQNFYNKGDSEELLRTIRPGVEKFIERKSLASVYSNDRKVGASLGCGTVQHPDVQYRNCEPTSRITTGLMRWAMKSDTQFVQDLRDFKNQGVCSALEKISNEEKDDTVCCGGHGFELTLNRDGKKRKFSVSHPANGGLLLEYNTGGLRDEKTWSLYQYNLHYNVLFNPWDSEADYQYAMAASAMARATDRCAMQSAIKCESLDLNKVKLMRASHRTLAPAKPNFGGRKAGAH